MNESPILNSDTGAPESLTDALQAQIAFYKGEYENLRVETKSLVEENNQLTRQLNEALHHDFTEQREDVHQLHNKYREMQDNLKQQLQLCEKEKDSFQALWMTSQGAVKTLEEELRAYQTYQTSTSLHSDIEEVKREYSSVIRMLENKITTLQSDLIVKEEAYKAMCDENNNLKKSLSDSQVELGEFKEKDSNANIKINVLEKDLGFTKNQLTSCKQNCEELLSAMEFCRQNIDTYAKKEAESRNKVAESLRVVDAAIAERDAALGREKSANDECTRLSNQVTDVLNESSQRIQKEIDLAKQGYNEKLNDMLIHIQRLELEIGEKNLALERALRDCKMLEDEVERHRKGAGEGDDETNYKVLLLEQKLEATFQQLILSERRNIQIVSEKESLQMDYDQLTSGFQRDKKRREWEEKLQRNQLNSLRTQIANLKESLAEAHKTIQSLQTELIAKEQQQTTLSNEKDTAANEFQRHFETQQKLNVKWKESMKEITFKLETRLEELKITNKRLRKDNAKLRIKCGEEPTCSESDSLKS